MADRDLMIDPTTYVRPTVRIELRLVAPIAATDQESVAALLTRIYAVLDAIPGVSCEGAVVGHLQGLSFHPASGAPDGPSPSRARAPGDPRQETDVQSDLT